MSQVTSLVTSEGLHVLDLSTKKRWSISTTAYVKVPEPSLRKSEGAEWPQVTGSQQMTHCVYFGKCPKHFPSQSEELRAVMQQRKSYDF